MASIPIVKRLFNSGELSPKVYGRTDLDRYEGGVKALENFVSIPQGGVVRRPGTRYIATIKHNTAATVAVYPFVFSLNQAYIIESGNGYFRFFRDKGVILGNNNSPYEIVSPYTLFQVHNVQQSQSFDTVYLYHQNKYPQQLTRSSHNNWAIGNVSFTNAPSDWSANNGYPRTGAFYQDRHVLASPTLYPSRLYFSKTSNYVDMTTGTNDADGFVINLLSGTSDTIFWMSSHRELIAGADSGVWSVSSANGSTSAITPTNRKARKETYFGSSEKPPAILGEHIIYSQYLSDKVRDLSYSYESDAYGSSELSVLADHLLEGKKVYQVSYQQSPFEIVWVRMNDGTLCALTYLAEHKVIGWSKHDFGGYINSIACIPGNNETELWMSITRTRNNDSITSIEVMEPFYFGNNMNNAFFVDSGISGSANSSNVFGLNHLEGRVVQYLADGVAGTATVSNGAITLSVSSANNLVVGLGYNSVIETLPIEVEVKSGPTMFKTKRITGMSLRVRDSAGGTYGPDNNTQTSLMSNNSIFSGDITNKSVRGGYNTNRTVVIKQTVPYPLNIDAIGLEVEVE